MTVEEYSQQVADTVPRTPVARLAIRECAGLVLAEPVHAAEPMPPFDNSAMDGYAVRAADLAAASRSRPVVLPVSAHIPAGRRDPITREPGSACRIMTGAPVPSNADAVVPVELAVTDGEWVGFHSPVADRRHIRRAGEDRAAGELVLTAGTVLAPNALATAAGCGQASLSVRRRLRVVVLTSGSELVEPGTILSHGQIFDTNATMVAAAVEDAGARVVMVATVADDEGELLDVVDRVRDRADLLITAGGISAGDQDVVRNAFRGTGVHFGSVAIRPGAPQGVGFHRDLPVVALPGNPVAAWVSFQVFVRPALRTAMAMPNAAPTFARLAAPVAGKSGVRVFRLGRYDHTTGRVAPVPGSGSHLLGALGQANCLITVPEGRPELLPGSSVEIMLTSTEGSLR